MGLEKKLAYSEYVKIISKEHRGLVDLSKFLTQDPDSWETDPIITLIDYHRDDASSSSPAISTSTDYYGLATVPAWCHGRIIIIEDIHGPLVEYLGRELDIDPQFFARHISPVPRDPIDRLSATSQNYLPSSASQTKIHFSYKAALDLGDMQNEVLAQYGHYQTNANIKRSSVLLPYTIASRQVAIMQGYCSMVVAYRANSWICLVLVDPTVDYVRSNVGGIIGSAKLRCKQVHRVFATGNLPSYSGIAASGLRETKTPLNMRERILRAFESDPPGFSRLKPSTTSLSYHLVQCVASEWVGNIRIMFQYLATYDGPQHSSRSHLSEANLLALNNWRRQNHVSLYRLRGLSANISDWVTESHEVEKCKQLIIKDIEYIAAQTQDLVKALEEQMQQTATVIQLLDTRRSIAEAINVRRVTYIALIFVPLSWSASLFSMADDYSPGGSQFWVYWATAIPLVALVFAFSGTTFDRLVERLTIRLRQLGKTDADLGQGSRDRRVVYLPEY